MLVNNLPRLPQSKYVHVRVVWETYANNRVHNSALSWWVGLSCYPQEGEKFMAYSCLTLKVDLAFWWNSSDNFLDIGWFLLLLLHARDFTDSSLPLGQQMSWWGGYSLLLLQIFVSHWDVGDICQVRLGKLLPDLFFPWSPWTLWNRVREPVLNHAC